VAQARTAVTIPLSPKSIQDLAWGLSLFFSPNEQERKFGEDVKNKWDKIVERYKGDAKAETFLDNVHAVMSSTIYSLAQLRKQVNDQFTFLDALKTRQIKNLDDLANLSKDAESIATRIAGISIGGGISFIGLATNVLGANGIFTFIMGAGISYFVLEFFLRRHCNKKVPQIMEEIQKKKEEFLSKEFTPKSKGVLKELLEKVNEIAEKIYGKKYTTLTPKNIRKLSSSSAKVTGGSYLTGGTIPTSEIVIESSELFK
jgi:hypothetical protein